MNSEKLVAEDVEHETAKFRTAVNQAIDDIESLIRESSGALSDTERDMLEMQIEMLADPQLNIDVIVQITERRTPAVGAVWEASEQLIRTLGELDSEYLRARASDVRACAEHIVRHIRREPATLRDVPASSVIVAEDISPVEALSIDLNHVAGIVTRFGGATSHAAILARARSIPAVVACGDKLATVASGDYLVADGSTGHVWQNPNENIRTEFVGKQAAFAEDRTLLRALASTDATTVDGLEIRLLANIAGDEDMDQALTLGAAGAGLFRTEVLFMNCSSFPTEEEQFNCYKRVIQRANGLPVTVRTLDVGGDKPLSYLHLPTEANPFLGFRAIRISLDQVDRFQEQLRAILRASVFGDLRIMFPMIGSVSEIRQARSVLQEAKRQLAAEGIAFNNSLPVGIMIETPAAAVIADLLAREVDFFSIGTNDLCQYTLAVDRGNEKVNARYDPYHPSVLRLIANTVEQASKHGIEVSMCGEMAGDVKATLLLIGIGLRNFSMTPASIPYIKRAIRQGSHVRALQVAADVMDMEDAEQIKEYLNEEVLNRA